MLRPLAHAPVPVTAWEQLPGAVVSGFFVAPTLTVLRTIASTYMGGVGENIGQRHTPLITLADCVRGTAQDGGTW
jgi:hypothetical protein